MLRKNILSAIIVGAIATTGIAFAQDANNTQETTQAQKPQHKGMFKMADADRDGKLNSKELNTLIENTTKNINDCRSKLKDFAAVDLDKNGFITLDELAVAYKDPFANSQPPVRLHDGMRPHDDKAPRDGMRPHDNKGSRDGMRPHDNKGPRDGIRPHDGQGPHDGKTRRHEPRMDPTLAESLRLNHKAYRMLAHGDNNHDLKLDQKEYEQLIKDEQAFMNKRISAIEGLSKADTDKDGFVTRDEFKNYMRNQMKPQHRIDAPATKRPADKQ